MGVINDKEEQDHHGWLVDVGLFEESSINQGIFEWPIFSFASWGWYVDECIQIWIWHRRRLGWWYQWRNKGEDGSEGGNLLSRYIFTSINSFDQNFIDLWSIQINCIWFVSMPAAIQLVIIYKTNGIIFLVYLSWFWNKVKFIMHQKRSWWKWKQKNIISRYFLWLTSK